MSDVPLGRFASQVVINQHQREYDPDCVEREKAYAKERLIRATLDKLPEEQPFVFKYKTSIRHERGFLDNTGISGDNEVHTIELEIMPVETMRITIQEFDNTRIVPRPITSPESFWDKAKSWYEDAQKGVAYE